MTKASLKLINFMWAYFVKISIQ